LIRDKGSAAQRSAMLVNPLPLAIANGIPPVAPDGSLKEIFATPGSRRRRDTGLPASGAAKCGGGQGSLIAS